MKQINSKKVLMDPKNISKLLIHETFKTEMDREIKISSYDENLQHR